MKKTNCLLIYLTNLITIFILILFFPGCTSEKFSINNLTTEYTTTPLGIDVEQPRFAWQMQAPENERGIYQTAYQINVKNPSGEVVWNSGKVNETTALGIKYDGKPLLSSTRYNWSVTVWDQDNQQHIANSWFETGLMDQDISAWDGAQWIGGTDDDLVFFSQYQIIFKMKYSLAIDKGSEKAGLVYGANDTRLMDKYKNIFQLENAKNESYIKLELDISSVDGSSEGLAKLNVYRVGYTPDDTANKPFKTFQIKSSVINQNNKNDIHHFDIQSAFGRITITLNNQSDFFIKEDSNETENSFIWFGSESRGASVNLNPMGSGGDSMPFGMVCELGFAMEPGQKAAFSNLEIYNNRLPNNTLFKENLSGSYNGIFKEKVAVENGVYLAYGGQNGMFEVADPSRNSIPMLRTEFKTLKKVESARLYVTARGIYEVYINGKKVGNDYYNPGQTQYNKSHFYQTYDVTDMVQKGENAMGAMLSEGWWSGLLSFGSVWNHFGDRQSLLAKLDITYSDGSTETITSNDKNWKYFGNGPIIFSSLDLGEIYDATKESAIEGWAEIGFDESEWKSAGIVPLDGTTYNGEEGGLNQPLTKFDFEDMKLIGQIGNNAGQYETLTAQSMEEVRPGVYVYDMGQNFVGVPQITFANGIVGDTVILRVSEMLYPNLPESGDNVEMIMTENYRAALCQDIYIMKNGEQFYQPKFTSRGYQYIEITGIDKPLPLDAVEGIAISSVLKLSADYKTSNPKVNQLWLNLCWSNVDNFLTLPTDCPQRNERMGWSGDISVFSRTATYVSNSDQFLRRHMFAMRDVQSANGRFADIAPVGGGFGGVLWGSAGITIPWEAYLQFNDVALLEENYDAMVAYIDYIYGTINKKTGMVGDAQLGDWLGPQNNQLGSQFLATAYHIFDLWIVKNVAKILGKTEDVSRIEKMYKQRKDFFNRTFINEEGKTLALIGGGRGFGPGSASKSEFKVADTQTSYAVGLALGAFNNEQIPKMAANLAKTVERNNTDDGGVVRPEFSLMTGFIGTAWISKALSDNGYNKQAYKLLQNNQYPSWLYAIDQGATTIWERLNGYTVENGFGGNNSMNSFNHYSFGAVGQWMIAYSLGIQRDEPGFQKFILQPTPDPTREMTSAEGYYDSMYGKIKSKWEVKDEHLFYEATVPSNTSATLYLPAKSQNDIINTDGCEMEKFEDGKAVFHLKSGTYSFKTVL